MQAQQELQDLIPQTLHEVTCDVSSPELTPGDTKVLAFAHFVGHVEALVGRLLGDRQNGYLSASFLDSMLQARTALRDLGSEPHQINKLPVIHVTRRDPNAG
jgi:hypothetical protein